MLIYGANSLSKIKIGEDSNTLEPTQGKVVLIYPYKAEKHFNVRNVSAS